MSSQYTLAQLGITNQTLRDLTSDQTQVRTVRLRVGAPVFSGLSSPDISVFAESKSAEFPFVIASAPATHDESPSSTSRPRSRSVTRSSHEMEY